jgi:hypothetical protein
MSVLATGHWLAIWLLGATWGAAAAEPVTIPVGGRTGIDGLRLVRLGGVEASAKRAGGALTVTFRTRGDERRLIALESRAGDAKGIAAAKALAIQYSLRIAGGAARLALVAYEKGGAAWFRIAPRPLAAGEDGEARLPLGSFQRAAFSRGGGETINWGNVERLWVAFVLDGPAAGTLELRRAIFTSEPYRPAQPLAVPCLAARLWNVSHDKAATVNMSFPKEGPKGGPCAKVDFTFPGGRHMYAVPSVALGDVELEGYRSLRFTYKADVPKGIAGLLVMLLERGGAQYHVVPAPPPSGEWRTVTIPFARFQLGGWSKDANSRLDLNNVRAVAIGVHGTPTDRQAKGTLRIANMEFVP